MTFIQKLNNSLGRVPPWTLYLVSVFPPAWFLYLGLTGGLGVEPIKELEHLLGELALQLFIVTLAVRPLRDWTGINLLKHRRALGLITFFYVALHLLVWLVLDVGILSQIWADILKRPYITIGMGAFVLMLPLAVTSHNWSVRRMGAAWRKLHKLVYPIAILGAVHYIMVKKVWELEPMIYLCVILGLVALRLPDLRRKQVA